MPPKATAAVRPGQVWETTDPRDAGRRVRVRSVEAGVAHVITVVAPPDRPGCRGRQTKLRIRESGPRQPLGDWRLVQHPDGTAAGGR